MSAKADGTSETLLPASETTAPEPAHATIAEPEKAGKLRLHGWFYGIGSGILSIYDPAKGRFDDVVE